MPTFCTIILKRSLLNSGSAKKKLWNLFLITFLKMLQPGDVRKNCLMNGAALLKTQPQLLFEINCVPCCRMSPLPLFPRNCVKSLHHFLVRFVFAIFFIFTVFFVSVRTDTIVYVMLHCDRVCCPRWLLIYLQNLPRFWIVLHLLFKGVIWAGIIMAW